MDAYPTEGIKIATWNIDNKRECRTYLKQIAVKGVDIICLQEVSKSFVEGIELEKVEGKEYHTGAYTVTNRAGDIQYDIVYWSNPYTGEASTMGLMILYKREVLIEPSASNPEVTGYYSMKGTIGSKSQKRGYLWIQVLNGVKIYTHHSVSSGDNKDHRNAVAIDISTLLGGKPGAVFGDFNLEVDYAKGGFKDHGLKIISVGQATRDSGRELDYCVCTSDTGVSPVEKMELSVSDHYPVLFKMKYIPDSDSESESEAD